MHKSETKHWNEWIHWHQECKFSLGVIVWLNKLSINLLYLPIKLTLLLVQVGEQKLLTVFHWHWSGASPRDIGSTLALKICWSQVKLWSRGWEMPKLPPFWRGTWRYLLPMFFEGCREDNKIDYFLGLYVFESKQDRKINPTQTAYDRRLGTFLQHLLFS